MLRRIIRLKQNFLPFNLSLTYALLRIGLFMVTCRMNSPENDGLLPVRG